MSNIGYSRFRRYCLAGTALGGLIGISGTAAAQTAPVTEMAAAAPAAEAAQSGDIVVTARKQTERLLDVPVNVTAYNNTTLSKDGIKDLYDLMQSTPSLSYATAGQRNQVKLTMRGLGVSTTGVNKASVFLDGVYIAGDFTGLSLVGLDRVEILKGPQSAVFGRSTFAGAINYVTKQPSNRTEGSLSVDGASFGEVHADAYVSGPIVDDKLYGFVSASYYNMDAPSAWTDVDHTHHGAQSSRGFMAKLVYTPSERLSIKGLFSYSKIDDGPGSALFVNPAARNLTIPKINPLTGASVTPSLYFTGAIPTFNPQAGDYRYFQSYESDPGDRARQYRTYLQASYDLLDHTISLTGARNWQNSEDETNTQFGPRPTVAGATDRTAVALNHYRDTSVELRIASPQNQWIRYAAGLYYLNFNQYTLPQSVYTIASTAAADRVNDGDTAFTGTRDESAFASLYVDPISRVTVSAEVRYQQERIIRQSVPYATVLVSSYTGGFTPVNSAGIVNLRGTFKSWLPRFNVQYKFSPNANIYITYSKGSNPGTFNTSPYRLPDQTDVKEETLNNYEIGFKARLFHTLSIEAAAYFEDWLNQQTTGSYYSYCTSTGASCMVNPSGTSTVANLYSVVENRGHSTIKGAEIDATWQTPFKGLSIRDGLSFNDGKYKKYCSSNLAAIAYNNNAPPYNCVSVAGNSLESISKWLNSFNADYETRITDDLSMYLRGDWQYQSKQYESELNLAYQPGFSIYNARIGLEKGNWTFELFGKNLSNNHTPYRLTRSSDPQASLAGVTGGVTNQYNQSVTFVPRMPRQFGAKISYKF